MNRRTYQIMTLLADIIIVAVAFLFMVWLKPASRSRYLPSHLNFFIILAIIWFAVSLLSGKLHGGKVVNIKSLVYRTLLSNTISLSIAVFLLFVLQRQGYSRMIVLGTALVATALEIIIGIIYLAIRKATVQDYQSISEYRAIHSISEQEMVGMAETEEVSEEVTRGMPEEMVEALIKEWGQELATGVLNIAGNKLNGKSRIVSTTTSFNISSLPDKDYSYIINLHRINDIKGLNRFFEEVNYKVKQGGYFLCCVETKNLRKKRLLAKFPPGLNYLFYTADFIVKRVFPKLGITRWLYLLLTKGENVVISRAEALGRISKAGFVITNESFINKCLFIEGKKCRAPLKSDSSNYGLLIALPRVGRNGEIINVYKMRTMHPYSEYIQDYVYNLHDLQEGGKFKNDFRITSWGGFSRKIWLDELPMLINFFKREMKMVGVRPLSKQYFNLYSEEVRNRRIRFKPGLIPPFYVHMPQNIEEIQASEMKYLDEYEKHPFWTDVKYFFVSFWNILFRHARSN